MFGTQRSHEWCRHRKFQWQQALVDKNIDVRPNEAIVPFSCELDIFDDLHTKETNN